MPPADPVRTLTQLGGVTGRAALVRLCGQRVVSAALDSGAIVRLNRSTLMLPGLDSARAGAIKHGGMVSHQSAAIAHGWKVLRPPCAPMITVPHHRNVRGDTTLQVRYADLGEFERGATTCPVRTVLDCARELPDAEALSVVDSALRSRKVTKSQLRAATLTGVRRGRARCLTLIDLGDARAANPFESALRSIAASVPGFAAQPQCRVGPVGHGDVGDPERRIVLEAESFEFHALKEAFNHDVRRYTAMTRLGWRVARFTWDDVMHRPSYVRAVIVDLMRLGD